MAILTILCLLFVTTSTLAESPEGYLFFDKELRLQVAKPVPKMLLTLTNTPDSASDQGPWKTEVKQIFLGLTNETPERVEPLEGGALLHLSTDLAPQAIMDLGRTLRQDPRVAFAFPIVVINGVEHQVEGKVYLKLDERLSTAERKGIVAEIASELKGGLGSEGRGIIQHGSNELVYVIQLRSMRGVKDPFTLARRLALSRTKGIVWAIPGLRRLANPVTLDVSIEVVETGERRKDVSILLGDKVVYIARVTFESPAEPMHDKVVGAIQDLIVQQADGQKLSPLFVRRGELREDHKGNVWEWHLPLRIYKPGSFTFKLPSLKYRDLEGKKAVFIPLQSASVFIPSRAYAKQRVNPLKELPETILPQRLPPERPPPVIHSALLNVVGGGAILTGLLILALLLIPGRKPFPIPSQEMSTPRRYQDMVTRLGENPLKLQEIRRVAWDLQVACRDGVLPTSLQAFATQLLELTEACFRPGPNSVDEENKRKVSETLTALEAALKREGEV